MSPRTRFGARWRDLQRAIVVLRVAVLGVAFSGFAVAGCGSHEPPVATLLEVSATVENSRAASPESWAAARSGQRFGVGDGVRTGADGVARLEMAGGARLRLAEGTTIRFSAGRGAHSRYRLGVQTGAAEIEGDGNDLDVETEFGVAYLDHGTRVRLAHEPNGTRLEVLVGRARLEEEGQPPSVLERGQSLVVSMGGAIIEPSVPVTHDMAVAPTIVADASTPAALVDAATSSPDLAGPAAALPLAATASTVMARVSGGEAETIGSRSGAWTAIGRGDQALAPGARLRLHKNAVVKLRRNGESATVTGPAEVQIGVSPGPILEVTTGQIALASSTGPLRVRVPGGIIEVRGAGAGTPTEVNVASGGAAHVRTRSGTALVEGKGVRETFSSGESGSLAADGSITVDGVVTHADLTISADESLTLHDPHPPTPVRFDFARTCPAPGKGVIEVVGQSPARGVGNAIVLVRKGRHKVRLRCLLESGLPGDVKSTTTVNILADAGAATLPRTPPQNTVDSDGRVYVVLYQNRLPVLNFRWPNPPSASGYTLHVTGPKANVPATRTPTAARSLSSGDLVEGTYKFWFEGDKGSRSPETTLKVDFDNAAPAANIRLPEEGGHWEGATVHVAGTTLIGSTVTVAGTTLPLDAHQRFEAEVPHPPEGEPLWIRIAHPEHGVHYYVRRSGKP